jgi:hypothetical protein
MNNDGFGQVGAGQNDRRLCGEDLQHCVQSGCGGPVREYLDKEKARHDEGLALSKQHLEKHYSRPYNSQH